MRSHLGVNIGIDTNTQEQIAMMVREALDERLESIEDADLENVVGAALALTVEAMLMK